MHRLLLLSFFAFHLGCIVMHNAAAGLASYVEVCGDAGSAGALRPGLRPLYRITGLAPVAFYSHYAGIATGYGFFAPQVGSTYTLHTTVTNPAGDTVEHRSQPPLRRNNSRLRYTSFLDQFSGLLPPTRPVTPADSVHRRYLRLLARQMAIRQCSATTGTLRLRVLLYRHPLLKHYRPGTSARVYTVYEETLPIRP